LEGKDTFADKNSPSHLTEDGIQRLEGPVVELELSTVPFQDQVFRRRDSGRLKGRVAQLAVGAEQPRIRRGGRVGCDRKKEQRPWEDPVIFPFVTNVTNVPRRRGRQKEMETIFHNQPVLNGSLASSSHRICESQASHRRSQPSGIQRFQGSAKMRLKPAGGRYRR
jgi:hypothetical protein